MMQRERQIAGLFGITVGIILLLILPNLMPKEAPAEFEPIDRAEMQFPDQFCENVKLGNPGGLSYSMALVCVNPEFEVVMNADHLKAEKWNKLIQPVLDSLHTEARKAGVNTKRYVR